MPPLPADLLELLGRANPAVIATVRPDGQPVSVATWYLLDGVDILLTMDARRRRLDHLRQDPRVSLTVLDDASWYSHVSLQGRVTDLYDDEGLADADRISQHYGGRPYPDRERPRTTGRMVVEHWHGWVSNRDT